MRYIIEAITPTGIVNHCTARTWQDARALAAAMGWANGVRVEIHRIH
jgi:hypothetical protein